MGHCKSSAKGRFIAIQAYLKKQEKRQRDNLTLHLKQLEKEEMKNPTVRRRKDILKIREEINAKETKGTIAKINKAKRWFFEKVNKIDKSLARIIKKQREKNQINKIRNENGEITIDNTEIQRIIRDYYQQLFFGTLHSDVFIFPFPLCFLLLFFSQLFVRPPQTAILLFCISFPWGWS